MMLQDMRGQLPGDDISESPDGRHFQFLEGAIPRPDRIVGVMPRVRFVQTDVSEVRGQIALNPSQSPVRPREVLEVVFQNDATGKIIIHNSL